MSFKRPRTTAQVGATCLLALTGAALSGAEEAPKEPLTLTEALTTGDFGGMLRYRFDQLDQDPFEKKAYASTLRTSLHYGTKPFHGLSGYVDLYDVETVGNDLYNDTYNGGSPTGSGRPVIVDPVGRGVNEAYGEFANKDLGDITAKVGRQLFTINDEVFVTASRYRQNNNRFDAATLDSQPLPGLQVQYGYVWHNIDVTDRVVPMSTNIGNLAYAIKDVGRLAAYGVLLDFRDRDTGDVSTVGVRINGPFKLSEEFSITYEADYAQQDDYADNPTTIDATYYLAHVGVALSKWYLSVAYRNQSGVDGSSAAPFEASQIGYPWPWRGNTEQLVFTPTNGLETIMVWGGGAVPGVSGLSFDLWFFDYASTEQDIDYGTEISGQLNYIMPFDKNWSILALVAKAAEGDEANGAFADATRAVFMTTYAF